MIHIVRQYQLYLMCCFFGIVFTCGLVGCGNPEVAVVPVSGTVFIDGVPAEGVQINFQPCAKNSDNLIAGPGSYAVTNSEGYFALKTVDKDLQGAVQGIHKVRMVPANGRASGIEQSVVSELAIPRFAMDGSIKFLVPEDGTDQAVFQLSSNGEKPRK